MTNHYRGSGKSLDSDFSFSAKRGTMQLLSLQMGESPYSDSQFQAVKATIRVELLKSDDIRVGEVLEVLYSVKFEEFLKYVEMEL